MIAGSCLCGRIAYEAEAVEGIVVLCHCQTCRKATGSAFVSMGRARRAGFRWLRGEELLSSYESSPGKLRRFCSVCGSPLVAERAAQSTVMLRLGCVDGPIGEPQKVHIWRSDGAPWFDPDESLPKLDGDLL